MIVIEAMFRAWSKEVIQVELTDHQITDCVDLLHEVHRISAACTLIVKALTSNSIICAPDFVRITAVALCRSSPVNVSAVTDYRGWVCLSPETRS
jgi:hypothetical protein